MKCIFPLSIILTSLTLAASLPEGFVNLSDIDPTIIVSLRYATEENFTGQKVPGYKSNKALMTRPAAEALKRVQETVNKDGYNLVIYDAYRPQHASNFFVEWSCNLKDQIKKISYYPHINKKDIYVLDYVSKRSGHSRGSAVDISLIKKDTKLHEVKPVARILGQTTFLYLDDGTIDMGSSFDLFDTLSNTDNPSILPEHQKNRTYLKEVMSQQGFKNWPGEWWHFTYKPELFPADKDRSYFDFPVQ